MTIPEMRRSIEMYLAKGKIKEAVDLLLDATEKSDERVRDDAIQLSGRFYEAYQKDWQGLKEDPSTEYNHIRKAVLELVKELPVEPVVSKEQPASVPDPVAHPDPDAPIQVYLSVGTPHNEVQQRYLDTLKSELARNHIVAHTLGSTFWSVKKPLLPIQKSMKEVSGCLVLAMERFFAVEGLYKRGSSQEKKIVNELYSTPWSQIEAAMAYQAGLPLFIMKDESIRGEGMLDPATHDWMIVHIDPSKPEELLKDPIQAFIKSWAEDVKAFHRTQL